MKAIRCDLPYAEQIEIHPMADLHLGDPHSDYKAIVERIEHIKNTDNAYCILDGDLMDAAIASSIGDTYGASLQPMEQLKQCVKLFVNTSAALTYGGYGDKQGYKPSSTTAPVIYLNGTEHKMWAKL